MMIMKVIIIIMRVFHRDDCDVSEWEEDTNWKMRQWLSQIRASMSWTKHWK